MAIVYKQTNSKWKNKPYKTKCTVGGSGCGLVAVTNLLVEYDKYKNATPLTFYDYMRKGAVDYDGTLRKYVKQALGYYGLKDIQLFGSRPISEAWPLMAKGYRGVFVVSNKRGGSKKTLWTTTAHYIAVTDYKYEGGKHKLYIKDSGWRNHDGWFSYEENLKGAVADVIIGDCSALKAQSTNTSTEQKKTLQEATKLVCDGSWGVNTTKASQKKLGTYVDGIISGQLEKHKKYHTACMGNSWKYGKGGSVTVKAIQKLVGAAQDGFCGPDTIKAMQRRLGVSADGVLGSQTVTAWQKYLNGDLTLKPIEKTSGEKIAELAVKCAYSSECASAKYHGGKIKAEYKTNLNKAYPNRSSWGAPPRAGASCDVFVGTCIVASGVDASFPRGLQDQYPHMEKSSKWELVTTNPKASDLKDGDVIIYCSEGTKPTHIMLYAVYKLRHAHYDKWYGRTTSDVASRLKGKKWIKVYRAR